MLSWLATACHTIAGLSRLLVPSGMHKKSVSITSITASGVRQHKAAPACRQSPNTCRITASRSPRQASGTGSSSSSRKATKGNAALNQGASPPHKQQHAHAHTCTCNTYPHSVLGARRLSDAMLCCFCFAPPQPAPRYAPTKAPTTQQHGLIIITTFIKQ